MGTSSALFARIDIFYFIAALFARIDICYFIDVYLLLEWEQAQNTVQATALFARIDICYFIDV